MRTPLNLFEAKFIKTDGCWEWTAYKLPSGYGQTWFNGRIQRAHRVAYQLYTGKITDNLQVCHHCDNPGCVNPAHLFLGTNADNVHDCMNKGRWADRVGENNGHSKLTEDDILTIRTMWTNGATQFDLAREFGVSRPQISRIVHHHTWANV